ncbi:MAG: hypothetical protein MUF05_06645 [Candidatus Omnitrophica bacterium]|jgi:hypothetical protein|nr:hypothetical protein [Candidatus Omnitrophota bacterium]
MGIAYKVTDEIKQLILLKKKENPKISCRALNLLIQEQFQVDISKSSINAVFKESGLSMPVGRRSRPKKSIAPELKERIRKALALAQPVTELNPTSESQATSQKPQETKAEEPSKVEPIFEPKPEPKPEPVPEPVPEPRFIPVSIPQAIAPQEDKFLEAITTGVILLKAVDSLFKGLPRLNNQIFNKTSYYNEQSLKRLEALFYSSLFDNFLLNPSLEPEIWPLLGANFSKEDFLAYLNELERVKEMVFPEIGRLMGTIPEEVRSLKIMLSSGKYLYFDPRFYTVWSTPYITYDFSLTLSKTRIYANQALNEKNIWILFSAPGYERPTEEFVDLFNACEGKDDAYVSSLIFQGERFEDINIFKFDQYKKTGLIFAVWPWQFVNYRKVQSISDFCPFEIKPLGKKIFVASIEINILQPDKNQWFTLKGAAVKASLGDKISLLILKNSLLANLSTEDLCHAYFQRWPAPELTFQDYSRKMELFTYTADAQRFFSWVDAQEKPAEIKEYLERYLYFLDAYFRWHFLPASYQDVDFSTMKSRFYNLKTKLSAFDKHYTAEFIFPENCAWRKDLEYAFLRLNETGCSFQEKRIWFKL